MLKTLYLLGFTSMVMLNDDPRPQPDDLFARLFNSYQVTDVEKDGASRFITQSLPGGMNLRNLTVTYMDHGCFHYVKEQIHFGEQVKGIGVYITGNRTKETHCVADRNRLEYFLQRLYNQCNNLMGHKAGSPREYEFASIQYLEISDGFRTIHIPVNGNQVYLNFRDALLHYGQLR